MQVMKVILIFLQLWVSDEASAQWLCREASSTRNGQTITACGVGRSQNLDEARVKSRESAVEEFKRVCQLSSDCSDYDYSVVPKRTECEMKEELHICFRALEFEISRNKKKSVSLDLTDLEKDLKQKNQEIQNIQTRIEKVNQIKKSEQDAALKKKELADLEASLNQKEAEALKLQDLNSKETIESGRYRYLHQIYKNSIKGSLYYWSSKLTSDVQRDFLYVATYERRPSSWFGVQGYIGFASGYLDNQKNSDSEVPTSGTRNSTQAFNGNLSYFNIGFATLFYSGWRGTYLKADVGQAAGTKESYTVTYNGSGVGIPQKDSTSFSLGYLGVGLGFDTRDEKRGWGVFFEVGARKLHDRSNSGFIGGVGVNYGF